MLYFELQLAKTVTKKQGKRIRVQGSLSPLLIKLL